MAQLAPKKPVQTRTIHRRALKFATQISPLLNLICLVLVLIPKVGPIAQGALNQALVKLSKANGAISNSDIVIWHV